MLESRHADGILDMYNKQNTRVREAIKELNKIAFAHPELAKRLHMVVRGLEKTK